MQKNLLELFLLVPWFKVSDIVMHSEGKGAEVGILTFKGPVQWITIETLQADLKDPVRLQHANQHVLLI